MPRLSNIDAAFIALSPDVADRYSMSEDAQDVRVQNILNDMTRARVAAYFSLVCAGFFVPSALTCVFAPTTSTEEDRRVMILSGAVTGITALAIKHLYQTTRRLQAAVENIEWLEII